VEIEINTCNGHTLNGRAVRVAVAEPNADHRAHLQRLLAGLGHPLVAVADDPDHLLERCMEARPELAILSTQVHSGHALSLAQRLYQQGAILTLLLADEEEAVPLERPTAETVVAVLARPLRAVELGAAVTLGLCHFERLQTLTRETAALRQSLEERKLVERAKGAVSQRLRIGEQAAYDQLRKLASRQNLKLVDVARNVLAAEQTFAILERC
jgi:response regulator NasT